MFEAIRYLRLRVFLAIVELRPLRRNTVFAKPPRQPLVEGPAYLATWMLGASACLSIASILMKASVLETTPAV